MSAESQQPESVAHTVGLIGCAPSGTMALERLAAELLASPLESPVEIHAFDSTPLFGPGGIYDPEQPDYLLTNVSVGDFDMWPGGELPSVVADPQLLHDWCHRISIPMAEGRHAPRALAGRYLAAGFEAIAERLPTGVTLNLHIGEVIDIEPHDGRYRIVYRARHPAGHEGSIDCDQLLLATGHTRCLPAPEETGYASFADQHPRCAFLSDVYPVDAMLARVVPGSTVAVKGMSLTFIDAVLALTEGVGGRFEQIQGAAGQLRYLPSGREPARIVPFSRTGLPARPRASDITRHKPQAVFCTHEAFKALRKEAPGDKIDFADLWTLYERDMEWAYYRVRMAGTDFEHRLKACNDDFDAIRSLIESFQDHPAGQHSDMQAGFDACRLLNPVGSRSFTNGADFRAFALRHLRGENFKARQGAAKNAEKAAIESWRSCRLAMLPFLAAGSLTPASHRKLHTEIWPRMQQLVFGPPLENMEKILALAEAGVLDFSVALAPEVIPCDHVGAFRLRCRRTASEVVAEILVDARVPSFDLARDASMLYRNLARRGLVRAFENAWPGEPSFRPGGIDLTPDSRFVVAADGRVNPDISVTGVPTQGCIYDNISPLQQERSHPAGIWAAGVVARLRQKERGSRNIGSKMYAKG